MFAIEDTFHAIADRSTVSPQGLLEQEERKSVLLKAVNQLPQNQRIAFTLHKFEELSYKETAAVMETSLSSVEALMHRAKKNLKKKLAYYYQKTMSN